MEASKAVDDTPKSDKATGRADICGATTSLQRLLERRSQSQENNCDIANGRFDLYSLFGLAPFWKIRRIDLQCRKYNCASKDRSMCSYRLAHPWYHKRSAKTSRLRVPSWKDGHKRFRENISKTAMKSSVVAEAREEWRQHQWT
jgi:hypothetical protein